MIKLNNGAEVLALKIQKDFDGPALHGKVLAKTHSEYVTWRVSSFDGGETFDAYSGHYLNPGDLGTDAYLAALNDFNVR